MVYMVDLFASVVKIAGLLGNIIFCLAISIYNVHANLKIQNYYIIALSISDFLIILPFC